MNVTFGIYSQHCDRQFFFRSLVAFVFIPFLSRARQFLVDLAQARISKCCGFLAFVFQRRALGMREKQEQ